MSGRTIRTYGLLAMLAAAVGAGCSDNNSTPTTPTSSTPVTVTETFAGTLNVNGGASFPFTAGAAGSVSASLASLGPDSTLSIGVSLGTWNGTACQHVVANDATFQGQTVLAQATASGSLCVRLYDAGKLVEPIAYTITVVHP